MKIPRPSVEPEPIYEFVKGKGWVLQCPKKVVYTYAELMNACVSFDTICTTCGYRFGSHWIGRRGVIYCQDTDVPFTM